MSSVSIVDVLDSISDDISLKLFKSIADDLQNNYNDDIQALKPSPSSSLLEVKSKITRKQYYSRMNRITKYGLAKRSKGRYSLTSLGKVIQHNLRIIENACQIQWKLKAIDSLESSSNIPADARMKIFNSLIEDQTIREILYCSSSETKKHSTAQQQTSSSVLLHK
jgi:predicted transcriptional regulator